MNVKLTKHKIEVLQNEIKCLVKKQQVQILQVSRVLGLMVASFPGVEYGPLFYRSLENRKIDALKISKGNFDSYMKLDQENLDDLNWWIQNIKGSCKNIKRDSPNVIVQTDASKKGWGAHIAHTCEKTGGRWSASESELHINELEMLAVLYALRSLCTDLKNVHIRVQSDNVTTVCYINSMGGSKARECNSIAKRIWLWCLDRNIWISAAHIPGTSNIVADNCSRSFNDSTEWKLDPKVFGKINEIWGPFDLDMFASRLNKQIEAYASWKPDPFATFIDAFSVPWSGIYLYAFPPFSMIGHCIQKLQQDMAEAVMIVPVWPTQSWFSKLLEMLVDVPRNLPCRQNLLTLPHSTKTHPLWKKMKLMICRVSGESSKPSEFRRKYGKSSESRGEARRGPSIQWPLRDGKCFVVKGVLIQLVPL